MKTRSAQTLGPPLTDGVAMKAPHPTAKTMVDSITGRNPIDTGQAAAAKTLGADG